MKREGEGRGLACRAAPSEREVEGGKGGGKAGQGRRKMRRRMRERKYKQDEHK